MIQLNLQRTWSEISECLTNNPNPLRIAELVNRVPPCSWTFQFIFNSTNQIDVLINCDSEVSDEYALSLLDGSLEEIFFADALSVRQTGKYFTKNTSQTLRDPPPSNLITFCNNSDREANFLLTLKGFWQSETVPPVIQQCSTIRSYFSENTWLGSPDFADSEYYIRWQVFAKEYLICPQNRYAIKLETESFTTRESLYNANREHIGHATFHTDPSLKNDEIYTTFGPFVPKKKNWLTRNRQYPYYWIVEINSEKLRQAVIRRDPTTILINELVNSVENAYILVTKSDSFQGYDQKIRRERRAESVDSLKERQERARKGARVLFKGKPVMLVPSNENEVLVLLSKLEALNALPFHEFILWEYTAQRGIDAIATYQIKPDRNQTMFATVEVEYRFENFLEHGHPHDQVDMVICWDFRKPETALETYKLYKHDEWLFEYRNDKSFYIVILSQISNLQIEEN